MHKDKQLAMSAGDGSHFNKKKKRPQSSKKNRGCVTTRKTSMPIQDQGNSRTKNRRRSVSEGIHVRRPFYQIQEKQNDSIKSNNATICDEFDDENADQVDVQNSNFIWVPGLVANHDTSTNTFDVQLLTYARLGNTVCYLSNSKRIFVTHSSC